MIKKSSKFLYSILMISTLIYVISNIIQNEFISNVSSPIASLSTGLLILILLKHLNNEKFSWIYLGLSSISWGLADGIWFYFDWVLNIDPTESVLLMYLYLIPNLLILLSGIMLFKKNVMKWNKMQLGLDIIATAVIAIIIFIFSFYNHIQIHDLNIHEKISVFSYWITDILAICFFMIFVSSSRNRKFEKTLFLLLFGYLLYVVVDLIYVYLSLLNFYIPNTLIDSLYIISLSLFGIAAYFEWKKPTLSDSLVDVSSPENFGSNYYTLAFLLIPVGLFLLKILSPIGLLVIFLSVILYFLLSNYIQLGIKNELLLKRERLLKEQLEELVSIRTLELRDTVTKLELLSITDSLSELYNRRFFMKYLDEMTKDNQNFFSVYYLDLNNFKVINDVHGHEMGDIILQEVSKRFKEWKIKETIVARLGGDEFAIIQTNTTEDNKLECITLCNEVNMLFDKIIKVGEYVFNIDVSIGISRFPLDALDRDSLVKFADLAMYQAKKKSEKENYIFYTPQQSEVLDRKNKIELYLKIIDYDKEFTLNYQPQISTVSHELIGVEALIRWTNPELGFVSPAEFISIAEETGCIVNIGKWVIENSFKQIMKWNKNSTKPIKIGINLSPMQFDAVDFYTHIIDQMNILEISPSWIDFEITENIAMSSGTIKTEIFEALSELGVQVSIDDFGTGYSSLSYLKRFNIDKIKIAKELIDHIVENHEERLIIKAIILMSKGMGIETIAEGVETKEQLDILEELNCDAIQGYYFSKPLKAEDFESLYSRF